MKNNSNGNESPTKKNKSLRKQSKERFDNKNVLTTNMSDNMTTHATEPKKIIKIKDENKLDLNKGGILNFTRSVKISKTTKEKDDCVFIKEIQNNKSNSGNNGSKKILSPIISKFKLDKSQMGIMNTEPVVSVSKSIKLKKTNKKNLETQNINFFNKNDLYYD